MKESKATILSDIINDIHINLDEYDISDRFENNIEKVFNLDHYIVPSSIINKNDSIYSKISKEKYKEIEAKVIDIMTNPTGTEEEQSKHNELLMRCAIGDILAQKQVKSLIIKHLTDNNLINSDLMDELANEIYRNKYGLGAIDDLFYDNTISEIEVNGAEHIWIDKNGKKERLPKRYASDEDVERVIRLMLRYDKKTISPTNPKVESRMKDGSRLTVSIAPIAKRPYINIRKFESFKISTENYLKAGTYNKEMIADIESYVRGRANIIISGETNSGKTTLLKHICGFVRPDYRIGTIETNFELKLDELYTDKNIFSYEQNESLKDCTMLDLFKLCLRADPTIIIVGEARGCEAEEMIKSMRRGHEGSIGTIHTSSPENAILDLASMIEEDGKARDPLNLVKRITSAIDIFIQMRRFEDGTRRISRISEIWNTSETDPNYRYEIRDLWVWKVDSKHSNGGYFERTNNVSDNLLAKFKNFELEEEKINALKRNIK